MRKSTIANFFYEIRVFGILRIDAEFTVELNGEWLDSRKAPRPSYGL